MSPRFLLLARLLLLLTAGGAVAFAFVSSRVGAVTSRERSSAEATAGYACPMHPEVTSAEASVCPICRMALEPVTPAPMDRLPVQSFDLVRSRTFGQDVRAAAWLDGRGGVIASLYKDELIVLSDRTEARFMVAGAVAAVVRRAPGPPEPWDRSTVRVRFLLPGGAASIPPGSVGSLQIDGTTRTLQVVPSSALIEGALGPAVLVPAKDGHLERRPVEVGRVVGGLAFLVSGVAPQERVLVRGTFLADAQLRIERPAGGP